MFASAAPIVLVIAVAAAVVTLYLMRPSPRRLSVSSTLIWRRVLRSRRRTPDRLRWWLSLLLALLIAVAISVSLSWRHLFAPVASSGRLVLVLDNSITLSTLTSDGRTRWEHALERARELIRAGGEGGRYMVADTGREIASPRFEEADAALATLQRLRVQASRAEMFPGVLETSGSDLHAVFITDGVGPVTPPPEVETVSVFQPAENAGITAFEVRALPADPRRYQAYVEITNASRRAREADLSISGAGHLSITRRITIAAEGRVGEVFDVSIFAGGPLRATVSMGADALAVDDTAFSYLPHRRVLKVGVVSPGNVVLERALRLLPRVEVVSMPPSRYREGADVDAWVFDRYAPRRAPALP
ncbi:MAG: hypothetical protein C5B46_07245, partial [Proteobacteria bacterium]